jgi:hypothetical protein
LLVQVEHQGQEREDLPRLLLPACLVVLPDLRVEVGQRRPWHRAVEAEAHLVEQAAAAVAAEHGLDRGARGGERRHALDDGTCLLLDVAAVRERPRELDHELHRGHQARGSARGLYEERPACPARECAIVGTHVGEGRRLARRNRDQGVRPELLGCAQEFQRRLRVRPLDPEDERRAPPGGRALEHLHAPQPFVPGERADLACELRPDHAVYAAAVEEVDLALQVVVVDCTRSGVRRGHDDEGA